MRPRHEARAPVIVPIEVGQQAQAGGRAHLQQGERLRQPRERRKQDRAARRLVRLRRAREHDLAHMRRLLADDLDEVVAAARDAGGLADRGEKQIWLLAIFGQAGQKLQQFGRARDGERELLVGRR